MQQTTDAREKAIALRKTLQKINCEFRCCLDNEIALEAISNYGRACASEAWEQAANELVRRMEPERVSTDDLVWKFIDWCRQQAGGGGDER